MSRIYDGLALILSTMCTAQVDVSPNALIDIMGKAGIVGLVLSFTLWRDWKRETNMTERIQKVEDERIARMEALVNKVTEAILANSRAMDHCSQNQDRVASLVDELKKDK